MLLLSSSCSALLSLPVAAPASSPLRLPPPTHLEQRSVAVIPFPPLALKCSTSLLIPLLRRRPKSTPPSLLSPPLPPEPPDPPDPPPPSQLPSSWQIRRRSSSAIPPPSRLTFLQSVTEFHLATPAFSSLQISITGLCSAVTSFLYRSKMESTIFSDEYLVSGAPKSSFHDQLLSPSTIKYIWVLALVFMVGFGIKCSPKEVHDSSIYQASHVFTWLSVSPALSFTIVVWLHVLIRQLDTLISFLLKPLSTSSPFHSSAVLAPPPPSLLVFGVPVSTMSPEGPPPSEPPEPPDLPPPPLAISPLRLLSPSSALAGRSTTSIPSHDLPAYPLFSVICHVSNPLLRWIFVPNTIVPSYLPISLEYFITRVHIHPLGHLLSLIPKLFTYLKWFGC